MVIIVIFENLYFTR